MNYLDARRRTADGRWDYTNMNDGQIHAIGYCAGWRPFTGDETWLPGGKAEADRLNAEEEPFRVKYHEDGHATEAEARYCYRTYLLDRRASRSKASNQQFRRIECGGWTQDMVQVGAYWFKPLCETHPLREALEKHYPPVGISAES